MGQGCLTGPHRVSMKDVSSVQWAPAIIKCLPLEFLCVSRGGGYLTKFNTGRLHPEV